MKLITFIASLALVVTPCLAACAPHTAPSSTDAPLASASTTIVDPTPATIVLSVVTSYDPPSQTLYIENHSTSPITVYSVTLRECQNLGDQCTARDIEIRVEPGKRGAVARVTPYNPDHSFQFKYDFRWRPD
jgi:hypothetical protein